MVREDIIHLTILTFQSPKETATTPRPPPSALRLPELLHPFQRLWGGRRTAPFCNSHLTRAFIAYIACSGVTLAELRVDKVKSLLW